MVPQQIISKKPLYRRVKEPVSKQFQFLQTAFSLNGNRHNSEEILSWIERQRSLNKVRVEQIPFNQMDQWSYNNFSFVHSSGRFFKLDGINVQTNWGKVSEWDQPIINQNEIGLLGFIVKEFNGILHFLVQAKIEPGNINHVQLSPTLQATRSNYTRVHKGRKPRYLDYFLNVNQDQILLDQLQSEQGARFLKKRNRNMIIKVDDDISLYENFIWLTLSQIKNLMNRDNLVNMDTRTVISGIPYGNFGEDVINFFSFLGYHLEEDNINSAFFRSALAEEGGLHTIDGIITFLTRLKSFYDLTITASPLHELDQWKFDEESIYHQSGKYFRAIAVNVEIENREKSVWSQPMFQPSQKGLCAIVCKEINGLIHFAMQAKLECGNQDLIELAPTVQCLTDNYKNASLPFLDYVLSAEGDQIIYDAYQSEEGGRFYHEQNRNLIILAGDEIDIELPEKYIWMTLNQLYTFLKFNNYLNIQARSLIAAISFV